MTEGPGELTPKEAGAHYLNQHGPVIYELYTWMGQALYTRMVNLKSSSHAWDLVAWAHHQRQLTPEHTPETLFALARLTLS